MPRLTTEIVSRAAKDLSWFSNPTPAFQLKFIAYLLGWIGEEQNIWFFDVQDTQDYQRGITDFTLALAREKGATNVYSSSPNGKARILTSADPDQD